MKNNLWILVILLLIPIVQATQVIVKTDVNVTMSADNLTWTTWYNGTNFTNSTLTNCRVMVDTADEDLDYTFNTTSFNNNMRLAFASDVNCGDTSQQRFIDLAQQCINTTNRQLDFLNAFMNCNITLTSVKEQWNYKDNYTMVNANLQSCQTEKSSITTERDNLKNKPVTYGIGGIILGALGVWFLYIRPKRGLSDPDKVQFPRAT